MNTVQRALSEYVRGLEEKGAFSSDPVRRAFETVERHRFLDSWYDAEVVNRRLVYHPIEYDRDRPTPEALSAIYSDRALITETDGFAPTSSTSQPILVARMLELLDLRPGMRVLEIGTGTGYNAALLSEIVGPDGAVCTVDLQENIAKQAKSFLHREGYDNVQVLCRDGCLGSPEAAPFDRIVATVGCSDVSEHWVEQLDDGGAMLVPLQHGLHDPLIGFVQDPDRAARVRGRVVGRSGFMPIQGALGWATPWRNTLMRGVPKTPTRVWALPGALTSERGTDHPLTDDPHRAFAFFLSLALRPLWYTDRGYGLADPVTSSVIVVTGEAIEGYAVIPSRNGIGCLHDALLNLLGVWEELGRPVPSDFDLSLVPKGDLSLGVVPDGTPGREWIMERPVHWEIVRLPSVAERPAGDGSPPPT